MSKTILITGASSGIGRATAVRLAAEGHTVFAAARRLDRLTELARETTGTVIPVELDVCDPDLVRRAADTVAGFAPDGLDVLVNNAGYALTGPAETLTTEAVRAQFETNVIGLFDVTRPGQRDLRRHQACRRGAVGRTADGAEAVRHQRRRGAAQLRRHGDRRHAPHDDQRRLDRGLRHARARDHRLPRRADQDGGGT